MIHKRPLLFLLTFFILTGVMVMGRGRFDRLRPVLAAQNDAGYVPVVETQTATPSPTNASTLCPLGTPEPLWVEPVVSPTDRLTQTLVVRIGAGAAVTVTTVSGVFTTTGSFDAYNTPAQLPLMLLPNTAHSLRVQATVRTVAWGGCAYGGYTLATERDRYGAPLVIVQQSSSSTATSTPNPRCVRDTNGDGIVDIVDIMSTAADPTCVSYLPLIVANWRQDWAPTATATHTPTATRPPPSATFTPTPTFISTLTPTSTPTLTPGGPRPAQPTGLVAFHRAGQTFLTWSEVGGLTGERYHVYRYTAPITAANIGQARRLTERWGALPEGSSSFWTERDRNPPITANYVINDLAAPLADTTGLFVWTSHQAGAFYYAITTQQDGVENLTDFGSGNRLAAAVNETPADPRPVLVWQATGGRGAVFTQYLDYESYNPTFDAPQETAHQQYAANYSIALPSAAACGGVPPASYPLYLYLTGWSGRYENPTETPYDWCAIQIYGDDPHQTWYYGHSASYDYRQGGTANSGPIVNYTEERLLRAVYDTLAGYGLGGLTPDPDRVYVYGGSMGGSGALALALRYGNVFAAAHAGEPMTNYAASDGAGGTTPWVNDVEWKWGSRTANLPIRNDGRYAAHLIGYNGMGVWDWQNHQAQLVNRRGDEAALISLNHGTQDTVIAWASQAQPVYGGFYQGRRAFSGAVENADHTWLGFAGIGPMLDYETTWAPFHNWAARRAETLPGLSYASGSSPVPPTGPAGYNLNLEWSATWHDFAGPPTDTPGLWAIALRTTDSSNQTVDVTPRRRQQFAIVPRTAYTWESRRLADDALLQSGSVVADGYSLITAAAVQVDGAGVRLSFRPSGGTPPPTVTSTRTPTITTTRTPTVTPSPITPTATPTPISGAQTVTLYAVADALIDTNINPNANLGALNYLELYQNDAVDTRHFLVRFDLGGLPAGATVLSARLELFGFDAGYDDGPQDAVVHRVTRAWVEGAGDDFYPDGRSQGVTWGQAAPGVPWTSPGGDYDAAQLARVTLPANPNEWFAWDVTAAAQVWAWGGINAGLLVRPENGAWRNHAFHSREADAVWRPRLVVTYSTANTATPTASATPSRTATGPTPTATATGTPTPTFTPLPGAARPWPDTTDGIHVFNDQLTQLRDLSEAQIAFAATHYVGTQKMVRGDADRLRVLNPNFLILHYRLGLGLGYRVAQGGCQPTGDYLYIIEGSGWVQEWPGEGVVQPAWFFPWAGQARVLNCDWGWYLMELSDASYRSWWSGEVLRQLAANDNDGLFADSLSVPNYLGYDHYSPPLPGIDTAFEAAWAARIHDWIAYVKGQFGDRYRFLPNVGNWVTTRETTDYSGADGVMIEGFAEWDAGSPFDLADWQLQMDRILGLTRLGKTFILQPYTDGSVADRVFLLSNYLLVKGTRSYINLDTGLNPEWWPEYGIPIGRYAGEIPAEVSALYDNAAGVYRRAYTNGQVLVNPGTTARDVALGGTYYLATPVGGGDVPPDGDISSWRVDYTAVTSVTLEPTHGAILLNSRP